ncbi:hypothetical protein [Mucilaginibacter psychrotolerans]|uniref:Uncharacterized protein n=1 Tax=Mucilaginibacter psychrotolerans TaxID=1524096 RepID=A0A4Y8SBL7_9SPHI|nr:hypothetical protein [Mucilaginibacter psychrotolerans]TFF36302.1 hypothetical protein E2R66_15815 [Mucilaginibacter psychrotolerans]
MKKILTYSLKVGFTTLLVSPILSLIIMYSFMALVYLIKPTNWGFAASIDFYDIAVLTSIITVVLPFAIYRAMKSTPGVYNKKSQITISTFFVSIPLFYVYFHIIRSVVGYSLGNILLMVVPNVLVAILSIRFYRLNIGTPVPGVDINEQ